jgi:hypothetical protein
MFGFAFCSYFVIQIVKAVYEGKTDNQYKKPTLIHNTPNSHIKPDTYPVSNLAPLNLDKPEMINAKAQSGKEAKKKKRLFLLFFASFASLR